MLATVELFIHNILLILGIRHYEYAHSTNIDIETQRDLNPGCLSPESMTLIPKL